MGGGREILLLWITQVTGIALPLYLLLSSSSVLALNMCGGVWAFGELFLREGVEAIFFLDVRVL